MDDALSIRRLPGGNLEVGVHIADVSYFVQQAGPQRRIALMVSPWSSIHV